MKVKLLLLISILLMLPVISSAQIVGSDATEITVEKSGQLEKAIKKANAQNAKKLGSAVLKRTAILS